MPSASLAATARLLQTSSASSCELRPFKGDMLAARLAAFPLGKCMSWPLALSMHSPKSQGQPCILTTWMSC